MLKNLYMRNVQVMDLTGDTSCQRCHRICTANASSPHALTTIRPSVTVSDKKVSTLIGYRCVLVRVGPNVSERTMPGTSLMTSAAPWWRAYKQRWLVSSLTTPCLSSPIMSSSSKHYIHTQTDNVRQDSNTTNSCHKEVAKSLKVTQGHLKWRPWVRRV